MKIISSFILNSIKYKNLQIVYDDIFKSLVNYILINEEINKIPTREEILIKDKIEIHMLTRQIFDCLSVKTNEGNYIFLSSIIYHMRMSMEDGKIPRGIR